jgi:hypothetical protein
MPVYPSKNVQYIRVHNAHTENKLSQKIHQTLNFFLIYQGKRIGREGEKGRGREEMGMSGWGDKGSGVGGRGVESERW